jgi:acyl carrier protein
MLPAHIAILDALPRLPGLKVDRKRLAAIDAERSADTGDRAADTIAARVASAMERVLGMTGVTPDDSLASLGGDSLQAVEVIAELERQFGLAIPHDTFAAAQSIRELADHIRDSLP